MKTKLKIIFLGIAFLIFPLFVYADTLGQQVKFNIDPSYDLQKREEILATLQKITNQIYFYLDDAWWQNLNSQEKSRVSEKLNNLAEEFENKIYPILTLNFGSEWKPGIDGDERITILIHPMIEEAGGYFNSGDEYPKVQNPKSNQREMVYLNSSFIDKPIIKSLLAHEFLHLITFNQKERLRKSEEEVWLNEARAEYVPTFLGYDDIYEDSNLQNRVKIFLERPNDSLTVWENKKSDYGVANLFIQYLVDHYGVKILADSLQIALSGIPSINYILEKSGFKEDFSKIFANWTITVLLNDCAQGQKYCYLNKNLKDLRIVPQLNFLPLTGESSLQLTYAFYDWTANWYKFVGGREKIVFEFDGQDEGKFLVNYLLCDFQGKCQIEKLILNEKQDGKILITGFNKDYQSLIIIPIIQTKISDLKGVQPTYLFTIKVSAIEKTEEEKEAEVIEKLLAQIEFLQKEIARVQAEIAAILAKKIGTPKESLRLPTGQACTFFENNLYYGMRNNSEVRCLQEFLKAQGPEIYPEGLVTGNFLSLTKVAVIRFQEKYGSEILAPLELKKGTGFVGEMTRAKINAMISGY